METSQTENQIAENEAVEQEVVIEDPKAVLDALNRAKIDAKKFREEKEKLENDLNTRDQLVAEYSGKLLREKVKSEFEKQGFKDSEKYFKFINFNELEFDEEYNVVGFDKQITQLKKDFPEIFDPKLRVGGQADGAVSTSINTRVSASELQAKKILGRV
jgi:hypothetical protein